MSRKWPTVVPERVTTRAMSSSVGKPVPVDVDGLAPPGHVSLVAEDGDPRVAHRAEDEPAPADRQDLLDLVGDVSREGVR